MISIQICLILCKLYLLFTIIIYLFDYKKVLYWKKKFIIFSFCFWEFPIGIKIIELFPLENASNLTYLQDKMAYLFFSQKEAVRSERVNKRCKCMYLALIGTTGPLCWVN